jgi:hypothetical protein
VGLKYPLPPVKIFLKATTSPHIDLNGQKITFFQRHLLNLLEISQISRKIFKQFLTSLKIILPFPRFLAWLMDGSNLALKKGIFGIALIFNGRGATV